MRGAAAVPANGRAAPPAPVERAPPIPSRPWPRLWPGLVLVLVIGVGGCGDDPAGLGAPRTGDWPVASPAEVGLAEQPLLDLKRDITAGAYGDVHSVLVVRSGRLAYEEYFGDGSPAALHRVYSVTKSVAATLVGVAWDRGFIQDLDRPLLEFFPEYASVANPEGKHAITLRHALRMRTGLEWDEWATSYNDPSNPTNGLYLSQDWMKFVLDLPLAAEPGTVFAYNSGVSMLLSGVIRNATGRRAADFADDVLFGHLGIEQLHWLEGPDEIDNTGWGLSLRSRDMARIGQLYLQRGVWNGERILSEAWIDASTEGATRFASGWGYGFQWWLVPPARGDSAAAWIPSAWGWGGQFIIVVPHLDAVIVTTQGNYDRLEGLDQERLVEIVAEAAAAAR